MSLNWDDLKIALAIGRAGSMTRAADMLGMDQSTVGRRLAALEAALGTVLFIRSKTGLTPTEAGEATISRASEVEIRMNRLTDQVSIGPDGPVGTVRLLGNPWVIERLATRSMAPFLAEHPKLNLRTVSLSPRVPNRGDASVSLWFEQAPREMEFAINLGAVPYAVYAARGVDPSTLDWVSFLDEDAPRLAPARATEKLRQKGEGLRLTATDANVLVSAITSGIGKGLVPMCLAEQNAKLVRTTEDTEPDLKRVLQLHMHPDTVQTQRVQAVIRWLRKNFSEDFTSQLPS